MAEMRRAVKGGGSAEAHNNLGVVLAEAGRYAEAAAQFRAVLRWKPESAEAHNNLAVALTNSGEFGEAMKHLRVLLAANPESGEVHGNVARLLAQGGRFDEAEAEWRRAIELSPGDAEAHFGLGDTAYARGRFAESIEYWRRGLLRDPTNAAVLAQIAWVLATCEAPGIRDGREAVRLATRALEQSGGKDGMIVATLAAAYAEAGLFEEAAAWGRRAMAMGRREVERWLPMFAAGIAVRGGVERSAR